MYKIEWVDILLLNLKIQEVISNIFFFESRYWYYQTICLIIVYPLRKSQVESTLPSNYICHVYYKFQGLKPSVLSWWGIYRWLKTNVGQARNPGVDINVHLMRLSTAAKKILCNLSWGDNRQITLRNQSFSLRFWFKNLAVAKRKSWPKLKIMAQLNRGPWYINWWDI